MVNKDGDCLVLLVGELAFERAIKLCWVDIIGSTGTTCPALIALNTCLPELLPLVHYGNLFIIPKRHPVHCCGVVW